jgi:hypothetical protein
MSKYKQVFDARKQEAEKKPELEIEQTQDPESGKSGNPEITKSENQELQKIKPQDKLVNLGIKVAESRRRHWGGRAKLEGVTISEVIIEALSKRFGEPK